MKSCPKSGEFDRSTGSNPLLSRPIPVVGLTIDRFIRGMCFVTHLAYTLITTLQLYTIIYIQ